MEILSCQRPQIVSSDFSTNFHPFWPCDGSLESSNPTLFNHMGTSHFNTSYSIRSCSFLSKFFLLILTGSIASKGIAFIIIQMMIDPCLCYFPVWPFTSGKRSINPYNPPCFDADSHFIPNSWTLKLVTVPFRVERNGFLDPKICSVYSDFASLIRLSH